MIIRLRIDWFACHGNKAILCSTSTVRSKFFGPVIVAFILTAALPLRATVSNAHENCTTYLPPGNNTLQHNISFDFNGNGVYVYFILSKQAAISCRFILDGEATTYTGSAVDAYQYNTLVISSEGLPSQAHTLTIVAEGKPNMPNYVNYDFARFTYTSSLSPITTEPDVYNNPSYALSRRPSTTLFTTSTNKTDPNAPSPSPTPQNSHTTLKAIIGGVVGGFIAVILLIAVAAFYQSRRLRELEDTAHPSIRILGRNEIRNDASRPTSDERQHLVSFPAPISPHHERSTTVLGVTPLDLSHVSHHHQSDMNLDRRDQRRAERQRELNHRLETVPTRMRSLKASYAQDQIRLQNALHPPRTRGSYIYSRQNRHPHDHPSNSDPPVIRLVPVECQVPSDLSLQAVPEKKIFFKSRSSPSYQRLPVLLPSRIPEPFSSRVEDRGLGEPMINLQVLAEMRGQMGIMMG